MTAYNEPANAFYTAIKDGKLKMSNFYTNTSGTLMWSATETSGEKNAISINSRSGSWEQRLSHLLVQLDQFVDSNKYLYIWTYRLFIRAQKHLRR